MEKSQLIDEVIIKNLQEWEKFGAKNLLANQVQNLLNLAPEYLAQIESALKIKNNRDACEKIISFGNLAGSTGAKKIREICLELQRIIIDGTEEGPHTEEVWNSLAEVTKLTTETIRKIAS